MPSSAAGAEQVTLPSPWQILKPSPPLTGGGAAFFERRIPGHIASEQRVVAGVDATGRPVEVTDLQRLVVFGKGDYAFVVPSPVTDVQTGPGSQSQPGLRRGGVIWQGFSPGRRVLEARIELRATAAAGALPLKLKLSQARSGDATRIELSLENATAARALAFSTTVDTLEIAKSLDAFVAAVGRGDQSVSAFVTARGPVKAHTYDVVVPLRVTGELELAGPARSVIGAERTPRGLRFRTTLGRMPLRITAVVPGAPKRPVPALRLTVDPPDPVSVLRPRGAPTWVALATSGRLPRGPAVVTLAIERILGAALARQFGTFLVNPDAAGPSRTTYVYRLASKQHAVRPSGGDSSAGWIAPLVAGVLACGAAVVFWAHS
ncbi:MAG: hypothetical protein M3R70_12600 [Actinomycetota bacterium]|nr:hypothetical protein [Actinomycetota bacterium]